MVNKLLITTAAVLGFTGAATAADFSVSGEYAVEAETFTTSLTVGQELYGVYFSATAEMVDTDYTGVDLGMNYGVTQNIDLFTTIEIDNEFGYEEATIGFSFSF